MTKAIKMKSTVLEMNILVVVESLTQKLIYSASLGLCGSGHRVLIQMLTPSTSMLRQNTKERKCCKTGKMLDV